MTTVCYLASNTLDHTVTFSYGGTRYEYFLPNPLSVSNVDYIARISTLKALNRAKQIALRVEKTKVSV